MVFPAYAGMFPGSQLEISTLTSFPRIRGDVPDIKTSGLIPRLFSPHTRGCSAAEIADSERKAVFPAYAGMFPWVRAVRNATLSFPRIRGDVPSELKPEMWPNAFSPHTRGCSATFLLPAPRHPVFPAYAGMFPTAVGTPVAGAGFPRIRGDVPGDYRIH